MEREREYRYLPLADALKSVGVKVHLFALASEFTLPSSSSNPKDKDKDKAKAKGNGTYLKLKIIDPSYPALGITVHFFADTHPNVPNVKSTHDIISLHNVTMKIREGESYCIYDKKHSSFALFEGAETESGNSVPYQVSPKYRNTDKDAVWLKQMRDWSTEREKYIVMTHQPLMLKKIEPFAIFDVICKVLHVSKSSNGEWILYVWDGTDVFPGMIWRKSQDDSQVPLQIEETPVSSDILCKFPCVGTVLRVFTKTNFTEIPKLQDNNNKLWVKICNMTCEMHGTSGLWMGILEPFGKIQILSDHDEFVKDRVREYENRLVRTDGRYPWLCLPGFPSVTVTNSPCIGYSTLMEFIKNEQAPQMKCLVRIVDIDSSKFGTHHETKLTIEDPTARIHAYLTGQDAERFFGGKYLPDEILKKKIEVLLGSYEWEEKGVMTTMIEPPLADFCLKSCYLQNGPSKVKKYMVVGTALYTFAIKS